MPNCTAIVPAVRDCYSSCWLPILVSKVTSVTSMKVLRELEVPKLATCRRQRCSLRSTVSSPLSHYSKPCNLRFRLSCTSIATNRLRKSTRSSTPLDGVQLYLGGVQLHSHSSCSVHDCYSCWRPPINIPKQRYARFTSYKRYISCTYDGGKWWQCVWSRHYLFR